MFKEEDIRPQKIFDEYLKLAAKDCKLYFNLEDNLKIKCPSCAEEGVFVLNKNGFDYEQCLQCLTLYVNPRPPASSFSKFYTEAESVTYWATTFYKETAESRREKIWRPKAKLISEIIKHHIVSNDTIVDIGGGYGVFAEEMRDLTGCSSIIIEPSSYLASVCRQKGFSVIEKFLEEVNLSDLPSTQKTFVSFELFEHLHDPKYFLEVLYGLMKKNDLFVFTTLSGIGLDIQALWQDSKAVSPPHHLNFFNPFSVKILLEKMELEVIEITTPGKLDIDILDKNRDLIKDRFWSAFINQATPEQRETMQLFIAEQGLSSHMMVVCRKK